MVRLVDKELTPESSADIKKAWGHGLRPQAYEHLLAGL
jgi:hypothetical protein